MAEVDDTVQLFAQPRKAKNKRKHAAHIDENYQDTKLRRTELNSGTRQQQPVPQQQHPQQQQQQRDQPLSQQQPGNELLEQKFTAHGSSNQGQNATCFQDLGVSDWLCAVLTSLGIKQPTQVQAGCIPAILQGQNVIGTAQTGSGKTAAFALPILQQLAKDPYGVFCLVLTPTR